MSVMAGLCKMQLLPIPTVNGFYASKMHLGSLFSLSKKSFISHDVNQSHDFIHTEGFKVILSDCGTEGGSEVRTPRTRKRPQRFTIDSYDARSKDIPKLHSLDSLSPNVDTLGLRNRSVLTLSRSEVCLA